MQSLVRWSCVVVLGVLLASPRAWGAEPPAAEPVPNELPRSWNLAEIEKQVPPFATEGKLYALAWKVMEDDRPMRVESCLVLKVLSEESEYGRWSLVHLYRHPEGKNRDWQMSMMHFSGKPGTKYFPGLEVLHVKRFKERPTNKDIYASLGLEDVGWSFEQKDDWKFVGCGVCEKTWLAAMGEKPTRFFGK